MKILRPTSASGSCKTSAKRTWVYETAAGYTAVLTGNTGELSICD